MATTNSQVTASVNKDDFRTYYQHQYERMSELENQRLTMTNVIVGLSVLAFSLAFADITKLNVVNAVGLLIVVLFANLIAVLFNHRSRAFIKMHQKRAHSALEAFAPEVEKLDKTIPKPFDSERDLFRRPQLQTYLHFLLMALAVLPIILYLRSL
jgi:DMSO reductase anchor subunit